MDCRLDALPRLRDMGLGQIQQQLIPLPHAKMRFHAGRRGARASTMRVDWVKKRECAGRICDHQHRGDRPLRRKVRLENHEKAVSVCSFGSTSRRLSSDLRMASSSSSPFIDPLRDAADRIRRSVPIARSPTPGACAPVAHIRKINFAFLPKADDIVRRTTCSLVSTPDIATLD